MVSASAALAFCWCAFSVHFGALQFPCMAEWDSTDLLSPSTPPGRSKLLHSGEVFPTPEFASSAVHVANTVEPKEHFSPALDHFSASVVALDQGECPAASGVSSFQDSWHLVRGGDSESLPTLWRQQ